MSGRTRFPEHAAAMVAKEKLRAERFSARRARTSAVSAASVALAAFSWAKRVAGAAKMSAARRRGVSFMRGKWEGGLGSAEAVPGGGVRLDERLNREFGDGVGFCEMVEEDQ